MIDPKELMIGNIVLHEGTEVKINDIHPALVTITNIECEPRSIEGYSCMTGTWDDRDWYKIIDPTFIHPIPPTPEILERCGFKQALNTPELYSAPDGLFNIINDYGSAWYNINKKVLEVGYYNNEIPCESLHHLQNLLTALGKKLEVK